MPRDYELDARTVGGPDAAIITGHDDQSEPSDLAMIKQNPDLIPAANERMIIGGALQRGIAEDLFPLITGKQIQWSDETRLNPAATWMRYTVDFYVVGEEAIGDVKVVFPDQRFKVGETIEDIPAKWNIQLWHYLECTGRKRAYIVIYLHDGMPRILVLESNKEAQRAIKAACYEFWRRFIVERQEPEIGDGPLVREWLKKTYPMPKAEIRRATEKEVDLLEEYAKARVRVTVAEEAKSRLENRLKHSIGDAEGIVWPHGRFTWLRTKEAKKTDFKSLAYELLPAMGPERDELIRKHTQLTEGVRRIYFRTDLLLAEPQITDVTPAVTFDAA